MSLLDLDDALARIAALLRPVEDLETLALEDALGRVCAHDVHAHTDIPGFVHSAMDGYAVRWSAAFTDALPLQLRLTGSSFAGHPFNGTLAADDECIRIFTGAPMPAGADTVVIQENVRVEGDHIAVLTTSQHGQWVRPAGHELKAGAAVIGGGTLLRAQHIGLCAAAGFAQLHVRRRIRVAVMSNGDELVAPGSTLAPGQIYDSNRITLKALLASEPAQVIDLGRVADNEAAIQSGFDRARAAGADLVLCSGGVSVGDADLIKGVLERNGDIDFWRIAIKPGKPLAFARLHSDTTPRWFLGLPGNPVSTFITYQTIVRPAIARLAGSLPAASVPMHARLLHALAKEPGRLELQRGVLASAADGTPEVRNTGNQSSGMLSSIVAANCFILLPREQADLEAGTLVRVLPFVGTLA